MAPVAFYPGPPVGCNDPDKKRLRELKLIIQKPLRLILCYIIESWHFCP